MDKIKTLRLADRRISITGLDPVTGQLKSVPSYKLEEVYSILVTVDKTNIIPPGDSGLSGAVKYEVIVQDAPAFCPFQKNDHIVIVGAPDGTTAWVRKGIVAEIIFLKETNAFADFNMPRTNNIPSAATQITNQTTSAIKDHQESVGR